MNNPLNTIFKPVNRTKFKKILETQTRPFPNNKINRIQVRYQTVFSRIMDIFSKSIFYNKEFLPRMNQRKKFMKINNKIFGKKVEPLTQEEQLIPEVPLIQKGGNIYDLDNMAESILNNVDDFIRFLYFFGYPLLSYR